VPVLRQEGGADRGPEPWRWAGPAKDQPCFGGWGCERCKDGWSVEHREPDHRPHVIEIVSARTRDQMILDGTISADRDVRASEGSPSHTFQNEG
jgi:hypothetical protein